MLPFSKVNNFIFGYFDPENIFLDNENNNFRGDLTDNSAKKEAMYSTGYLCTISIRYVNHAAQAENSSNKELPFMLTVERATERVTYRQ